MPITKEEEEEFERNSYILNQLKSNLEALAQQREMFSTAYTDVQKAFDSLENLEEQKGESELMVPIGGDCFINARSEEVDKVVVGIGGNIFVEKSIPDAKAILEKRIKLFNESAQKIMGNIQDLELKAQQLSQRNQEIYTKAQQQG
jgi:prefoldin alpha subunit